MQRKDLGKGVSYQEGMRVMREHIDEVAERGAVCLLLEHKNTITVTRQGGLTNVHATREELARDGFDLIETDRGGDVTFHGPGQLVGYCVLQLEYSGERVDLLGYLRALEMALIDACETLGVKGAHRKESMTGVWVASDVNAPKESWPNDDDAKKLVAIGVGVKRGVTRHGFALNMTTDLEAFTSRILPCGLENRGVTSLERVLGTPPDDDHVKGVVFAALMKHVAPLSSTS